MDSLLAQRVNEGKRRGNATVLPMVTNNVLAISGF
jgi:hypothetical protein